MSKRGKTPSIQQTQLYDKITKIQSKIIDRISKLKREKPKFQCKHFEGLSQTCDSYDPHTDYYQKYWKGFLLNQLCYARLQDARQHLTDLQERIGEVEELFDHHQQLLGGKGCKRNRRLADEVQKAHQCPYPRCFKGYGSEVSLNLHIKLKHNGGNKSQRDKAAELIWQARSNNRPIPTFYINLPPNFVEEYGRNRRVQSQSNHQEIYQE